MWTHLRRVLVGFGITIGVLGVAPHGHAQPPPASPQGENWTADSWCGPWCQDQGPRASDAMGRDRMGMERGMMGRNSGSMPRHRQFMMNGVPEPYASRSNPLPKTPETLAHGAAVYTKNCASCHGATGRGDGEGGRSLSPPSANLAWLSQMPMMRSDAFLYWAIAEGGVPFETAMPAFKDVLAPNDLWAVIAYIQAGLPPVEPKPSK